MSKQSPVFINHIATAVPPHDMHARFVSFAPQLAPTQTRLFNRMVSRAHIDHRYSVLTPHADPDRLDEAGFYQLGHFPGTQARMQAYQQFALPLAQQALNDLQGRTGPLNQITHLIVTSCSGFYAPGLDLEVIAHYGMRPGVERTMIGFMGCYAAINALKNAAHIVRADPTTKVLVLNIELCTLHLTHTQDLETLLCFLLFADGCAASLISADPTGIELTRFQADVLPDSADLITWHIGDAGFDMTLSGQVPQTLLQHLPARLPALLNGADSRDMRHWAVHPGGRSVLDGVEQALGLPATALDCSRQVLRQYGNMSSPSIMFVLQALQALNTPGPGCAMAFGPGIAVESMLFNL
jgi:alpha-pyrone synthase